MDCELQAASEYLNDIDSTMADACEVAAKVNDIPEEKVFDCIEIADHYGKFRCPGCPHRWWAGNYDVRRKQKEYLDKIAASAR